MTQRTSDNLVACSVSGRAEITAAIEGLAEEVARLARKINRIVPTANTQRNSSPEKAEFEAALRGAFARSSCEAQPLTTGEDKTIPLLPQQDPELTEAIVREFVEETNADIKTALPEPTSNTGQEENAIAARVADLYERLGGFIKTQVPKAPEHNN
jgi:hypothetical protein